jgi:hypothetical protein
VRYEDYSPEEQREMDIEIRLDILREYEHNVFNGIDAKKYRELFSVQLRDLFKMTGLKGERRVDYTMIILDYLKGDIDMYDVMDLFDFYIYQ